nr:hypothetical protein [Nocardia miyunensis]
MHAAGISGPWTGLLDLPESTWNQIMDAHAGGTFRICKAVLPGMVDEVSDASRNMKYIAAMGISLTMTRLCPEPPGGTVDEDDCVLVGMPSSTGVLMAVACRRGDADRSGRERATVRAPGTVRTS